MKADRRTRRKSPGKIILIVLVVAAVLAGGCGIWYYLGHNSSEPVYVYPFEYVGMTEYWGDSQESHGPVTTDRIQTVFLSQTQTVTEILVRQGDTVKKGDLLLTFDTTLTDLALERKRLEVEKLKLQLEDAKKELQKINAMKPMTFPSYSDEEPEEDLGEKLVGDYQISTRTEYDGSSPEKALICWLRSGVAIQDSILEAVRQKAEEYQNYNARYSELISPEEEEEGVADDSENLVENPDYVPFTVDCFYVVFKVTQGDAALGAKLTWQCMKVTGVESGFVFHFDDALIGDHMQVVIGDGETVQPGVDMGSGYTAAQIAQMRAEQQKKIKQLEFDIKMAEANYKIMQTEVGDGNVYAQLDGEIVSLLTEEEAKTTQQPILKLSGGGGFYVEVFVSELEKEKMMLGQEVTVNDWNTGMTYTGIVESIGDFPTTNGYYGGMGNPNASYYPFRVAVDGSADLQAGSYVGVVYSASEGEHGIYLQNPFLRTEGGKSFVFVMGADGRLEQRFVKTGKSLWGSYTEILEGLTAEDLVAFPYGKQVKDGAAAVESDYSTLYN